MLLSANGLTVTGTTTVGGGLMISNPTNATPAAGNALHVMAGGLIAKDLYIGGLLNGRGISPSSVCYYHVSSASLTQSISPFGYTYANNGPWILLKSSGADAANMLQSSGLFVAQNRALYNVTWSGQISGGASNIYILPVVSQFVMTGAQAANVAYIPQTSASGAFTMSYSLPMAVGDTFALSVYDPNRTIMLTTVSIVCQPLGAF